MILQWPTAVIEPAAADDVDSLSEALVARRVDGLEIVESAEDVVVPPLACLEHWQGRRGGKAKRVNTGLMISPPR